MTTRFKTSISKETFKLALSECLKKAWIWKDKENFMQAIKWRSENVFQYISKDEMETEDDFGSDDSQIDIYETYLNLDKIPLEERDEFIKKWELAWEDPNGFEMTKFAGETIEDGNAVGEAAREYYDLMNASNNLKNNLNLKTHSFEEDVNFNRAVEKTREIIKSNLQDYSYLYEPAFEYDSFNLKTRCDILKIKPDMHVEIIEVKATSKVKIEHFYDLMYQKYVLEKNGFIVDNVFICHLKDNYLKGRKDNAMYGELSDEAKDFIGTFSIIKYEEVETFFKNDYKPPVQFEETEIDLSEYFYVDPFSHGKSKKRNTLNDEMKDFEEIFNLDNLFTNLTNMLALPISGVEQYFKQKYCESKILRKPGKNGGWIYATSDEKNLPYCSHVTKWFDLRRETFFCLTGLKATEKAKIVWEARSPYFDDYTTLMDMSIPLKDNGNPMFSDKHHRIFESYKLKDEIQQDITKIINPATIDSLEEILSDYRQTPIYMYDFETVKWALPKFTMSKGYQQIPFQYSIDVIVDENYDYNKPETMPHYEFLGENEQDPRPQFIEGFIKDMFKHGPGVYVAYNDSFEKTVLNYLAYIFPQYAIPLLYIAQNTIDLMDFFKGSTKKDLPWFTIYHPNFHGSYSIKKTQPALEPNFSYKDLTINQGAKASQVFREYSDGRIPQQAWEKNIKEDMLKYCNRDTLAMVVILKKVEDIYAQWKEKQNDR